MTARIRRFRVGVEDRRVMIVTPTPPSNMNSGMARPRDNSAAVASAPSVSHQATKCTIVIKNMAMPRAMSMPWIRPLEPVAGTPTSDPAGAVCWEAVCAVIVPIVSRSQRLEIPHLAL